jgi:phenylacetate-CoA ligase
MSAKVIANGFLAAFVKRYAGPFWMRQRWLKKTQWLTAFELEGLQLRFLQKLVRHCYRTVPYYRDLMNRLGIKVEDVRTLEDIKKFPILTKQEALQQCDSIVSTKYPRWLMRTTHTSGTTGTPLKLRRSLFSIGDEYAFVRRQWDWAGIGLSDRCAYLKGAVIGEKASKSSRLFAYDPIMKELHLSTFHLSLETAKDYAELIKRYKVKAIVGYPSSVNIFARGCLDSGIKLKLESALITSETMTQSTRDIIAKAFDCKLYDFYGAAERVSYIHTCEHGSYHIIPEYGLTETIPVDGGEKGRCKLVATGFWNLAMPLVRYDTEDVVVLSDKKCPCGRAFAVVESIDGREGDVIRTPSGTELGVCIVAYIIYVSCGADRIIESQIIQDALDHITIEYVPDEKFTPELLGEFEERLAKYLPSDLKFTLKKVDAVRRTASGKVKPVVSLIDG